MTISTSRLELTICKGNCNVRKSRCKNRWGL